MITSQVKFNLLTREQVLGYLKSTGSKDQDVLLAAKEEFASNYRPIKWMGIWGMVCGVLMSLLIVLAPLGIPLFFLGVWWFRRAKKNAITIEGTYAEYLGTLTGKGGAPFGLNTNVA
jgi:uncharacterized membrane protein